MNEVAKIQAARRVARAVRDLVALTGDADEAVENAARRLGIPVEDVKTFVVAEITGVFANLEEKARIAQDVAEVKARAKALYR